MGKQKKNTGKAPSFQMYPADWLKDPRLKRASFRAKGVWIDVICHSFECEEKGVFRDDSGPLEEREILEMMGGNQREKRAGWEELKRRGIVKRDDDDGAFYCKRLRRDWALHLKRKAAGKLGGNPNLVVNQGVGNKVKQNDKELNQNGNQNLTPSASPSGKASASTPPLTPPPASPSNPTSRQTPEVVVVPTLPLVAPFSKASRPKRRHSRESRRPWSTGPS